MQYCELGTAFELACMRHNDGLASRVGFDELTAACADSIAECTADGRQVLLVGESFGATLALAVAHELEVRRGGATGVRGLVLVNPATSYRRSALAKVGPACASLSGPVLAPLYALSLIALAALVRLDGARRRVEEGVVRAHADEAEHCTQLALRVAQPILVG